MEKQVISIQGKPYTIFNNRDFLDLVDKFMGYDAMVALREHFERIDAEIEEIKVEHALEIEKEIERVKREIWLDEVESDWLSEGENDE